MAFPISVAVQRLFFYYDFFTPIHFPKVHRPVVQSLHTIDQIDNITGQATVEKMSVNTNIMLGNV